MKNPSDTKNKEMNQASTTSTSPVKAPSQIPTKTDASQTEKKHSASGEKKGNKTRITVKYDVGYSNQLYIRGKGANLSWDKGEAFKNVKSDEWIWETDAPFTQCEFKVLINDRVYENGDNHMIRCGASLIYTPQFY